MYIMKGVYHKELFEYLLEVLEDKYKKFKVDLKSR